MAQSSLARISYAQPDVPFPSSHLLSFRFPSYLLRLCFYSPSAASSHLLRCPSQLSCACRNDIHSWPKSFHLALTTFGILELTSRVDEEVDRRGTGRGGTLYPRWPLSAATAACRTFQFQFNLCNNFLHCRRTLNGKVTIDLSLSREARTAPTSDKSFWSI